MKKINNILALIFCSFLTYTSLAQTHSQNWSVQVTASVQVSPPQIQLHLEHPSELLEYTVYRKLKSEASWGTPIATLAGDATIFTDENVSIGISYEYKIFAERSSSPNGYAYINAGIEMTAVEDRGGILLVIDSTHYDSLLTEIQQLKLDLIGDGWMVHELKVSPTDSPPIVKAAIMDIYHSTIGLKTAYLLGHVPVPYSGRIVPDGHTNNHYGAWPADGYYGDMDGSWTDTSVNSTAGPTRIQNIPGDGKFDQSSFPSSLELQIGRVDLSNLPAFSASEVTLLRQYLNKAHAFKHGQIEVVTRGRVDDHFASLGEGFASNGYRNFPTLVGTENVETGDYFGGLNSGSYLWSYGCGPGSYTSAGGIGNTDNFVNSSPQGIFTVLFGSYFGDWDVSNNFLRAPLASGSILTNCWAGRPHWFFHHMALGENIGYSARLTQNNGNSLYYPGGSNQGGIHVALMGDPSLRQTPVQPPQNFAITTDNEHVNLEWTASNDLDLEGYYIYHSEQLTGPYTRLNDSPIVDTFYTQTCAMAGYYMVRTLKLEESPSGTYFNLSQGMIDSLVPEESFATDTILLNAGWNLISFDVALCHLSLPELEGFFSPNNLIVITGFDEGYHIYNPRFPPFFNDLNQLKSHLGYWVKVQEPDTLILLGLPLEVDALETLNSGWNLTSYTPELSQSATNYFEDLVASSNFQYACGFKNGQYRCYDSSLPPFLNSLTLVENSFGYWVKVIESVPPSNNIFKNPSFSFKPTRIASSLIGQVQLNDNPVSAGSQLLAFDLNNNCVGISEVSIHEGQSYIQLMIYGDDATTSEVDGMNENESFTLKLYDIDSDVHYDYHTSLSDWSASTGEAMPNYDNIDDVYNFEVALPLQLVQFDAQIKNKTVDLNWISASETNLSHFEIERSIDSKNWQFLEKVAARGSNNNTTRYERVDHLPFSETSYYQLKIVEQTGKIAYSNIRTIEFKNAFEAPIRVFPNPTKGDLMISIPENKSIHQIEIYNALGTKVQTILSSQFMNIGQERINLSTLGTGIYLLDIQIGEQHYLERVVID